MIINYFFYLHNNWYVEVKCQIGWMDEKAGLQQSKNFVTELMGELMDGWMDRWKRKPGLLNWWVNEWMGEIKLNYNDGPFSKVVRFLKFKFLIILKLN